MSGNKNQPTAAATTDASELQGKYDALAAELTAAKETVAQQAEALKDLQGKLTQAQAEAEKANAEKAAAEKAFAELLSSLQANAGADSGASSVTVDATKPAPVIPAPVKLADGRTVKFLKPRFNLNGNDYTAEQAAVLPELIEAVLQINGQQIIAIEG